MDAFYEESAVNQNAKKGQRKYKIFHYISWTCIIIAIMLLVIAFMLLPLKPKQEQYTTTEDYQAADDLYPAQLFFFFCWLGLGVFFLTLGVFFYLLKRRMNVQYDYIFVSGDLRVAKIFNINKRKFMEKICCEDIQQIGDVDNSTFDRLAASPGIKLVRYTTNISPAEGKFFMYIFTNAKKLYVLECREALLMNIMKFTRRSALESDYVMQEKKQR